MPRFHTLATLTLTGCLALSACTSATPVAVAPPPSGPTSAEGTPSEEVLRPQREVRAVSPRVVLAHEGGLLTLDPATGEQLADTPHPGFLRLNNAGDGRHVFVSDGDAFRLFDAGIQAKGHGDHHHYYESEIGLTGTAFDAPHAGHVVVHAGRTTLFADGTGEIQVMDSRFVGDPLRVIETHSTDAPHHGVAMELSDGSMLTTQGTEEERHTVQVLRDGAVAAETTDCPGVHGEAAAAPTASGDVVLLGCTNGPVVYRDAAWHKVTVPDAYARSGNLFGHEASPVVLGDYKTDPDADPVERPTRIALIDTRTDLVNLVDLGSAYWFRSLARGSAGESLVLTYDGELNVLAEDGTLLHEVPVISPWEEKADWQEPGPIVKAAGGFAYVTDAAANTLSVVDLTSGQVTATHPLPVTPVEMAVVTGHREAPTP
ncbi:MAG: hypothetical protein L0G22_07610 [Propionibacteriaceae bacterium]|nr:hypothetical protein [Propionibacteriaceae bacterium]